MDTKELSYYIVVCNQNTTIYGYEGDMVKLICPLSPPAESGRTTWGGPPNNSLYFYNNAKNPDAPRGERLSVMRNTVSGAYNFLIVNISMGIDEGIFICAVNTNPIQQYKIELKVYGEYIN